MTPDVSTSEVKLHLFEFELISANRVRSQINQFMSVLIVSCPVLTNILIQIRTTNPDSDKTVCPKISLRFKFDDRFGFELLFIVQYC